MKHGIIRRLIALSVALALCISTASAASSAFQDVPEDSAYAEAVAHLSQLGIVKGLSAQSFGPERTVTTAELATFLGRAAGADIDPAAAAEGLTDDGWSAGSVAWAKAAGLISSQGQYSALTVDEINDILARFCAMVGVDAQKAAGATRADLAVALDAIVSSSFQRLTGVKYTTVATAEDWGPAIGKVILDLGVEIDPASVSADKFSATSVRTVAGFDFATMTPTAPAPQPAPRTVTAAYVCGEDGSKAESGTRVAVEMKIGPEETAGSPFNYDFIRGLNSYVDTSYVISLKAPLSTKAGVPLSMEPTDAEGAAGSITLLADAFTEGTHTWKGGGKDITLGYASWLPHEDAGDGSTPLIIWLHGAGEGGTDPTIAIIGNKVVNLATEDIQKFFGDTGAAILAPQTPTMWMDLDGTGTYRNTENTDTGRSYYTDALKSLIDEYLSAHPEIDTDRIYVGGCSNGGYMTVNMIVEFPDFFAAAYPVCEAYDAAWLTDEMVESIKDLPIWLTHAKNDPTVVIYEGESDPENYMAYNLKLDEDGNPIPKANFSNDLFDRLTAAGAKDVHYSLFDDVHDASGLYNGADGKPYQYMGHWSWIYTLNNECVDTIGGEEVTLFQWLSQQSK